MVESSGEPKLEKEKNMAPGWLAWSFGAAPRYRAIHEI